MSLLFHKIKLFLFNFWSLIIYVHVVAINWTIWIYLNVHMTKPHCYEKPLFNQVTWTLTLPPSHDRIFATLHLTKNPRITEISQGVKFRKVILLKRNFNQMWKKPNVRLNHYTLILWIRVFLYWNLLPELVFQSVKLFFVSSNLRYAVRKYSAWHIGTLSPC